MDFLYCDIVVVETGINKRNEPIGIIASYGFIKPFFDGTENIRLANDFERLRYTQAR